MTEFFADMPMLTLIVKFMIASTVLLGAVWLLEKTRLINTPDLAELAWKLAIAGSFVALLPVGDWISSPITIQDARTSELARQFNEGRPLLNVGTQADAPATTGPSSTTPRTTADTLLRDPKSTTTGAGLPDRSPQDKPDGLLLQPPAAPDYTSPVTDSETIIIPEEDTAVGFWDEMVTLRTKDLIMLGWAATAALAALMLSLAYMVAVKALGSRERVTAEDGANRTLREICEKADIRHVPYLSRSSDIKSPVCLPRKEICLPDWAFDDLPEEELKSLLAHEVGHMVRRDPLMLMMLQMLSRLFFFQPLFILARKRLTDLAELAADEWAAKHLADARSVAAALFTCATKIHENRQIQWGLAMAGNKSMLKTRVERLIGADGTPFQQSGRLAKGAVVAGVMAVTLGLPSIQFADALHAGHPQDLTLSDWPMVVDQDAPALRQQWEALNGQRVVALEQLEMVELVEVAKLKEILATQGFVTELELVEPLKTVESLDAVHSLVLNAMVQRQEVLEPGRIRVVERLLEDAKMRAQESVHELSGKIAEMEQEFLEIAREFETRAEREFYEDEQLQEMLETVEARAEEAAAEVRRQTAALAAASAEMDRHSGSRIRRSIQSTDHSGTMVWSDNGYSVEASWDGRFKLSDDDRSIAWMEHGAELKLETKGKGPRRRIRIENEGGDLLNIRYWVDGDKTDLDRAGERWLGDTLLVLVRQIGLNADERVARLLKAGGPDAVIKEMRQIQSDYVARLYSSHLIQQAQLSNSQINKLVTRLERIESDYELRLALTQLFQLDQLDSKVMPRILSAAKTIDSDYELRLLLSPYIARFGVNDGSIKVILDLAEKMDSDYEMRLLLTQAMHDNTISEGNLEKFVAIATDQIDGDYELRLLLTSVADQYGRSKKATRLVVDALKQIDGDYERRLLLTMIVNEGSFDTKGWMAVIKAAKDIDGDYEKRLALTAIKGRMPGHKRLREAFDDAVKSIDSDYERGHLSAERGNSRTLRAPNGATLTATASATATAGAASNQ